MKKEQMRKDEKMEKEGIKREAEKREAGGEGKRRKSGKEIQKISRKKLREWHGIERRGRKRVNRSKRGITRSIDKEREGKKTKN